MSDFICLCILAKERDHNEKIIYYVECLVNQILTKEGEWNNNCENYVNILREETETLIWSLTRGVIFQTDHGDELILLLQNIYKLCMPVSCYQITWDILRNNMQDIFGGPFWCFIKSGVWYNSTIYRQRKGVDQIFFKTIMVSEIMIIKLNTYNILDDI